MSSGEGFGMRKGSENALQWRFSLFVAQLGHDA